MHFLASKNNFERIHDHAKEKTTVCNFCRPPTISIEGEIILRRASEKNKKFQIIFFTPKKVIPLMYNIFQGDLSAPPSEKVTAI